MKRYLMILVLSFFATFLLANVAWACIYIPPVENIDICHRTESEQNPWVEITIDENALETHLSHGDFIVDEENSCPPEDQEEEPTPIPTDTPDEDITPTPTEEPIVEQPSDSQGHQTSNISDSPPICNGVYADSATSGTGYRVDNDTVVMQWWASSSPHDSQILWYGSEEGNYPYSVVVPAGTGIQELNGLWWTGHTWARVDTVLANCVTTGSDFDP